MYKAILMILRQILVVLDGEVAAPCYLQSAIAGLNSFLRLIFCGAGPYKWR